jgi:hypothetical protein
MNDMEMNAIVLDCVKASQDAHNMLATEYNVVTEALQEERDLTKVKVLSRIQGHLDDITDLLLKIVRLMAGRQNVDIVPAAKKVRSGEAN